MTALLVMGMLIPARWRRRYAVVLVPVVLLMVAPYLAGVGLVVGIGVLAGRWRRRGSRVTARTEAVVEVVELTGLGLDGGLSLPAALELAANHAPAELHREVGAVLRAIRIAGVGPTLRTADGDAVRLYRVAARAVETGAPLRAEVRRLADDLGAELRAERLEAIRRLPVTLLFPLTLLILPGFLILTVAPPLLDSLRRLGL